MHDILLSHEAEKFYKRQPPEIKRKINRCIAGLASNPIFGPHIKRLHGHLAGTYRYAVGGMRILYSVDSDQGSVKVFAIGFRGDIYK